VRRVHRACVLACQPCAGERRRASAIAMSGSSRGTTTNCCRAPTCHTNDACGRPEQAPQQTGGRSSSSVARSAARRSSTAQQRGAALQQSEAQSHTSALSAVAWILILKFDSQVLMILKFRVHARQQTITTLWHEAVVPPVARGSGRRQPVGRRSCERGSVRRESIDTVAECTDTVERLNPVAERTACTTGQQMSAQRCSNHT